MTSLISAGQMVGQMAEFGGGGTYGPYGYYQPDQWVMAVRRQARRPRHRWDRWASR
jgi:hypothetical protein